MQLDQALEVAQSSEGRRALAFHVSGAELGRSLVMPPGVPADRVKVLRAAFRAMIEDPELVAEIAKSGRRSSRPPRTGREARPRSGERAARHCRTRGSNPSGPVISADHGPPNAPPSRRRVDRSAKLQQPIGDQGFRRDDRQVMSPDRRALLRSLATVLLGPERARAATVTDSAGRSVPVPTRVERVFPAGPPAAIMLYTLAPDLLLGWPRANRPQECAYMLPDICTRPEVGRITGRGNTANLETVLALKPDLILDIGSTNETFASLAARVQDQTGIP